MVIGRQLRVMARWIPLLIVGALLAAIPGYLYASRRDDVYEARARLAIDTSGQTRAEDQLVAIQRAADLATIAGTREFAGRVATRLDTGDDDRSVLAKLSITSASDAGLITIAAQDSDADDARALAAAAADELVASSRPTSVDPLGVQVGALLSVVQQAIDRASIRMTQLIALPSPTAEEQAEFDAIRATLGGLLNDYSQLRGLQAAERAHQLTVIEEAVRPQNPAGPNPIFFVILAAFGGLLVASAIAFLLAYRDDRLRTAQEIADTTGAEVITGIGERGADIRRGGPARLVAALDGDASADDYRALRGGVDMRTHGRPPSSLVITPSFTTKTAVAANLAIAYARAGSRVLLVDGDLRSPIVHELFGLANGFGLSNALTDDSFVLGQLIHGSGIDHLSVLPAGDAISTALDLVSSTRMRSVLSSMTSIFDVVILDAPSILRTPDAAALASMAEAVLLVAEQGATRRGQLEVARDALAIAEANLIGVALYRRTRGFSRRASQPTPDSPRDGRPASTRREHPRSP